MAVYEITGPDGSVYEVEGEGTEQEALQEFQRQQGVTPPPPTTIPTMLKGMESPVYGPGQAAPAPAMKKPASVMDWFRGGKTEAQIQDEKATEVRNLKAQAQYEALPGYVKPFQAASDLLTVGARLPASLMTGAAALVSPGEYKSITPEHVIARIRTGKTEGPEFEEELAKQKQAYEDAAYRSGWAGTAAQVAATAGLPIAKLFGAGKPLLNTVATGGAIGGAAAAGNEQDPLMGMGTGAAGGAGGYALGKGISFAGDKLLGVAGKVLPVGPLRVPPKTPPMTKDEFNALAKKAFDEAESHGVVFNKDGLIHLRDRIRQDLADKGYHPKNQPGLAATLETLDDYIATGNATQRGMQTLREMTSGGYVQGNKTNNMLVGKVINEIDDLGTRLDPKFISSTSANPKAAGVAAKQARKFYHQGAKLKETEDLIESGRLQGDTNISKNVRQSVRKKLKAIIDPRSPVGRGYTPAEKEAVRKAVTTTNAQDILHSLSGLVPRDKLSAAVTGTEMMGHALLAGKTGGISLLYTLPVTAARLGLGVAAEKLANRMAEKSVNELVHTIATGQTSRQAAQSVLQKLAASKRQAVMDGLAKVGYSLAAATQPLNEATGKHAQ